MKKILSITIILLITTYTFGQKNLKATITNYANNNSLSIERPYTDSITAPKPHNIILLNKEHWDIMLLNKIELYNDIFEYYIYSVYKQKGNTILLINRDYEHETYHWICILNKNLELLDYKTIAYDNAEGFLYIYSEIKKENITVNQWKLESEEIYFYKIKKNKFELQNVKIKK